MENIPQLLTWLSPARSMREAIELLEPHVRKYLSIVPRSEPITTDALAELIFPAALAKGEGITARSRLYRVLLSMATGPLADCAERGSVRKLAGRGRPIKPWLWSQSGPRNYDAMMRDRQIAADKFDRDFRSLFRSANRRFGFEEAHAMTMAVVKQFDDPAFNSLIEPPLEAGERIGDTADA